MSKTSLPRYADVAEHAAVHVACSHHPLTPLLVAVIDYTKGIWFLALSLITT